MQPYIWQTETSFLCRFLLWAFRRNDRIDQRSEFAGHLHDADAFRSVHLWRGEAEAIGGNCCFLHVLQQFQNVLRYLRYGLRLGSKNFVIGAGDDGESGDDLSIKERLIRFIRFLTLIMYSSLNLNNLNNLSNLTNPYVYTFVDICREALLRSSSID